MSHASGDPVVTELPTLSVEIQALRVLTRRMGLIIMGLEAVAIALILIRGV